MGLAFLIGASFFYTSFRGWQHVVAALAPGAKQRKSGRFALRSVLLGALALGIIKLLGLNVAAAVTGLLGSAAVVVLEPFPNSSMQEHEVDLWTTKLFNRFLGGPLDSLLNAIGRPPADPAHPWEVSQVIRGGQTSCL
ncbi:MAG TPA: hypothetical protein VEV17_19100 [Bryobacteraceae bacterium]|nr:hypothetical protein [Bryobacteraceae bacterium]